MAVFFTSAHSSISRKVTKWFMAVMILATVVVTFMVVLGLRNQKDNFTRATPELVEGTRAETSRDHVE